MESFGVGEIHPLRQERPNAYERGRDRRSAFRN